MTSNKKAKRLTHNERKELLLKTAVIIPTYNASRYWVRLHLALQEQGIANDQVLIVDSSSTDNTRELVRQAGYRLKVIPQETFRHGTTRQAAADMMPWAETLIYLTQDALPDGETSFVELLSAFENPRVGATYGRQLPRAEAGGIERHARLFNYPAKSGLRTFESREQLGIRAAFCSNSFAAYRHSALDEVGGFPADTIVAEDSFVAARMLMAKWEIAYNAETAVIHSHPLTMGQEFSRYFDTGVQHERQEWFINTFGGASGEGLSFVISQFRYLFETSPLSIPVAALRNLTKWMGYQLGRRERSIPLWLKERLSSQPDFWRPRKPVADAAESRFSTRPL
jgi:rhamnosyltransferase